MKYLLTLAVALFSFTWMPSYAENISSRTETLEREVAELKQELAEMKASKDVYHKVTPVQQVTPVPKVHSAPRPVTHTPAAPCHTCQVQAHTQISTPASAPAVRTTHTGASSMRSRQVIRAGSTSSGQLQPSAPVGPGSGAAPPGTSGSVVSGSAGPYEDVENVEDLPKTGTQFLPVNLDVPGQAFVSTGPFIGNEIDYAGSNLIINTPNINADVTLLNVRKNVENRLCSLGRPLGNYPHIMLSGIVETQAMYRKKGTGGNNSDIDLTSANLDIYILGARCITGLIEFAYENDVGTLSGAIMSNQRVANSRVFVNKGMIILGDFHCSPVYLSMGQMYVPFGTYSSSMIASPMTKILFRTKARAINIGYWGQGDIAVYGAAYAFRGDARVIRDARINNGGLNGGVKVKICDNSLDVGVGGIVNVADSLGMQFTENRPLFDGFGSPFNTCGPNGDQPCGNERLAHKVPGADIHATLSLGKTWDFLAEYIAATKRFAPSDLTYNSHGARPQAFNVEAAYTFQCTCKPLSLAVGYGFSKEALAFGIPSQRYATALNTSLWLDTLQSLEFRRDKFYPASAYSSGSEIQGPSGTGKWDSVITAQMDIYF